MVSYQGRVVSLELTRHSSHFAVDAEEACGT
jgi:hypothetical protein